MQLFAHTYSNFTGDSFQVYIKEPGQALRIALLCRAAISISQKEEVSFSDRQAAIGIGQVNTAVKTLGATRDGAFILSGRVLVEIAKTDTRLCISTLNSLANDGLQVIADYINPYIRQ